ncbi:hypothetical protein XENTR_v10007163 [Xenopus tropicalis]|uniref:Remodeling and spacing factor 1 n=1 Tax=Xenopus tropicalis TaxID=8364 RepID=A0A6I8T0S0_XENTR|nr:remodeling and spacing factor 1 isoform X2 [Xenopus tropicalis]KAE8627791.1 hypothetical protein XENTR_v10007163 [Xenopus tropicalis]KAE8627792.1 hypothetical protein XENTR_v10007163 [Xenopus tropicalis]KAE8627793.1 hypothetical protein XENTR_v10007163 [Xenopus tropicalis]
MAAAGAEAEASPVVPCSVGSWPDFAVVCSFLERYGTVLDLPDLTFPELEEALEETGAVAKPLVELHLKLLRKIGKSVTVDRWEKYLIKVCQEYNSTWAWEMEKKGYQEMSVECKVGILKHLCECQFDDNLKFKNAINEEEADAMRLQPIGRDKDGLMYWFQLDQDHNIRMYIEEQDDQDGSTWKCIVRTRNELAETLELLKAQIDPALLKKSEPQDSSSRESPNPEEDETKKQNGEGAPEDGAIKEEKPDEKSQQSPSNCKEEDQSNGLKTEDGQPIKSSLQIKTEPVSDMETDKQIAKEENDSFKENVKPVKEERTAPKDLKEPKGSTDRVIPPQEPERAEISVIVKRADDHAEKTVEETEKMKNDQQAKIPLKKRELKLTDDFDSPVKGSLCRSVTPSKDPLFKDDGKQDEDHVKTSLSTGPDGKRLVNGEMNCEKTTLKTKVSQVENKTNSVKETVTATKEENGILNERKNSGVIKIVHGSKEPSNASSNDSSEKDIDSNSVLPSDEKTEQKALSKVPPEGTEQSKISSDTKEVAEVTTEEPAVESSEDKSAIAKETSQPDTKSEVANKDPVLEKSKENSESKTIPQNLTEDQSKSEKSKVEPKQKVESVEPIKEASKDDPVVEPEMETKKTKKPQTSKKAATGAKNLTLKLEVPSESKPKEQDEEEVPKSLENDQKTSLKCKPKDKGVSKEASDSIVIKSTQKEKKQAGKTPVEEEEKVSNTEKPASKSRSRYKHDPVDESSETEGQETTSERHKEGIKLTIRTIRVASKNRRHEVPEAQPEISEEAEESIGRTLRRSPRISRPSVKPAAEVKDRKAEKKQSDEEDKPASQRTEKDDERKTDKDSSQKIKKNKPRQRRRARWTNSRSRRRRKSSSEDESEESDSEEDSEGDSEDEENKEDGAPGEDDEPCKKCGLPNHPELILLCDSCDSGYHTACLRPPLMLIPDGEWFCPPCQHKLLCEKLDEQLQNLDVVLKKKERAERRKERLVYVGISLENIIPTQEQEEVPEVQEKEEKKKKKPKSLERRSTRARKFISYRFDEFDEAIDEAIEDDIRDADGGGGATGRGKDMSNITGHRGKDISTILEGEKTEGKRPQRAVSRRKKRRRLNDLDSDSNMEEEESEDEFRISDGSQDEFVVSENAEESEEDQQSNESDFGARKPRRHYRQPVRKSRRIKKRSTRWRFSDDDDDDDEEDDSDEDPQESETEGSSDYSDDYLDTRRRRSRRNQKRMVNYREESESEGSQKAARYGRGKEMRRILKRRFSSSDSNASDYSKDSDDDLQHRGRKHALRKRIRSSNDEQSEEEEKPVKKRLNRIETDEDDDDDDEEEKEEKEKEKPKPADEKPPTVEKPPATSTLPESTKKPCYRIESDDDDDFDNVGKDGSPLDYSLVDLPSTNGQSPGKTIESLIGKPSEKSQATKDTSANISQASNGTGSNQEAAVPEEDEDELLRVTDLVDYVCNSEQL